MPMFITPDRLLYRVNYLRKIPKRKCQELDFLFRVVNVLSYIKNFLFIFLALFLGIINVFIEMLYTLLTLQCHF